MRDACDASLCVIVPMQKQLLLAPPFHPPNRILPPQPKEQLPCTLRRNDSQSMSDRTGGGSGAKRQRQMEEEKAAEPAALKMAAQAKFDERATSTATRDEFLTRYALNLLSIFTPHLLRPFAVRNFEALMRDDFRSVQLPQLQDVQNAMNRQRKRP